MMGWMVVFIHLGAFYRPSTGEHSLPPLGDGPMTKRRAQRILIGGPMLVLGHFLLAHLSLSIDESWPMLGLSLRLGSFLPGVLALYEIADGVAWYFGWREELELYALLKNKRTQ
ncbi:MAG: hypothetical protein U1C66_00445 [Patescibacteria group bacterium]|nr:hypothetical protein [Patescibacteria group bacterium]